MVVLLSSAPPAFILMLELLDSLLELELLPRLVVLLEVFCTELISFTLVVLAFFSLFNFEVEEDEADLADDFVLEAVADEVPLTDFSTLEVVLCSWDDSSVTDDDIATVTEELTTVFS